MSYVVGSVSIQDIMGGAVQNVATTLRLPTPPGLPGSQQTAQSKQGKLYVLSVEGETVSVDGAVKGTGYRITAMMPVGMHTIHVTGPRGTWDRSVNVTENQTTEVSPPPGFVAANSPAAINAAAQAGGMKLPLPLIAVAAAGLLYYAKMRG